MASPSLDTRPVMTLVFTDQLSRSCRGTVLTFHKGFPRAGVCHVISGPLFSMVPRRGRPPRRPAARGREGVTPEGTSRRGGHVGPELCAGSRRLSWVWGHVRDPACELARQDPATSRGRAVPGAAPRVLLSRAPRLHPAARPPAGKASFRCRMHGRLLLRSPKVNDSPGRALGPRASELPPGGQAPERGAQGSLQAPSPGLPSPRLRSEDPTAPSCPGNTAGHTSSPSQSGTRCPSRGDPWPPLAMMERGQRGDRGPRGHRTRTAAETRTVLVGRALGAPQAA